MTIRKQNSIKASIDAAFDESDFNYTKHTAWETARDTTAGVSAFATYFIHRVPAWAYDILTGSDYYLDEYYDRFTGWGQRDEKASHNLLADDIPNDLLFEEVKLTSLSGKQRPRYSSGYNVIRTSDITTEYIIASEDGYNSEVAGLQPVSQETLDKLNALRASAVAEYDQHMKVEYEKVAKATAEEAAEAEAWQRKRDEDRKAALNQQYIQADTLNKIAGLSAKDRQLVEALVAKLA